MQTYDPFIEGQSPTRSKQGNTTLLYTRLAFLFCVLGLRVVPLSQLTVQWQVCLDRSAVLLDANGFGDGG